MKENCNALNSVQALRVKPWFIYEPPTTAISSSKVWAVPPLFDGKVKSVKKTVVETAIPPYWGTDVSRTAFLGSSDRPFRHHGGSSEPSVVLSSNPAILAAIDHSRKSFSPITSQGKSLYAKPYAYPDLQSYSRTFNARS
ncbi:Hypothetical protein GLP15_3559 [Giardia lamblia P15]|uniref:Uncharacterized protein n=1 Tax=Giardia intestinalis (strain P15) TaxID=658858 RepID=E1F7I4_GIAIA|nr:Hypothetical protein GLP15_3559 [Giardia lamblia P15]